jgi:hypothetical protein
MQDKMRDAFHILEHKLLPELFFEGKAGFIDYATDKDPNGIFEVFRQIVETKALENPFSAGQFRRKMIELTDGRTADPYKEFALIVTYPEPEVASLCFKSFFLFDATCTTQGYYTLERVERNGKPYLYAWEKDLTRKFFGTISFDEEKQLRRIVEIYLQNREEENN